MRRIAAEAEAAAARPALEPSWRREREAPKLPVAREDFQAWQLLVAAATILHHRLIENWRSELTGDLAAQ
ncbi:hypothetical protein [Streptomyces sp. NPDC017890]|uniref:hypothetical protein n=1 Tax=Streptomyces sp. NPDC017890 TaxID=3365015 RepID=UPI0037A4213D